MKAHVVTTPRYEGLELVCCPTRRVERGEVILVQKINDVSHNVEEVIFHLDCVKQVIEAAPQPLSQRAYDTLRNRMIESGSAFPD